MAFNPRRTTWIGVALTGLLLIVGLLAFQWLPRWRENNVYQALHSSQAPAFWWPPEWRRELSTSFLLEGEVFLKDGEPKQVGGEHSVPPNQSRFGRPATPGTLELVSETQSQVFRTTVIQTGVTRSILSDCPPLHSRLGLSSQRVLRADGCKWGPSILVFTGSIGCSKCPSVSGSWLPFPSSSWCHFVIPARLIR